MVTAKREIMLNLPSQHKLSILQGLMVQQPVQFCPLCRGVAVFVLHGDAVDGKGSAILEPDFHPVGVHVVASGKQFVHKEASMFFTFASFAVESSGLSVCRFMNPLSDAALCRSTPIHHTPDSYTKTRTTLFLLCTKSCIVWRKIGVWRSFRWKSIKRKSLKLLGTSRSFRLCFAQIGNLLVDGLHRGEQQNIADGGAVGEQHDQAVHAKAHSFANLNGKLGISV